MFIYKALSAIAAAAFGAAVMLALPGFSPKVEAAAPAPVVSSDRVDAPAAAPTCAEQAWPYYDASCLRNSRPNTQPRTFRVVTTDRIAR
jgi:hypothetical protein